MSAQPENHIHNDEPTKVDGLSREQYANAFARVAERCGTPLVIGLYGTWGTGKTSLMRQIEAALHPDRAVAVWFDPWMHQFDENPVLALLHTLWQRLDGPAKDEAKKLLTVAAAAFGSTLLNAIPGITLPKISEIDRLGQRYEAERFMVRDQQVRMQDAVRESIEKIRKKIDNRRLVFFIDDLDRCMPKHALRMLEALKLYLNQENCVYFLGVDRHALQASIKHEYPLLDEHHTDYLDKIVQLPFHIPPIAAENMGTFIAPLLSNALKGCQELLVKGLGDNPRRVKRFINTLTLNHALADELNIKGFNPRLLTGLLLIQHLDIRLYDRIARDPGLLARLADVWKESEALRDELVKDEKITAVIELLDQLPDNTTVAQYIFLTDAVRVTEPDEADTGGSDLTEVLRRHALWVESNGKEGEQADLRGANLQEADLQRAKLQRADLLGADLLGADLLGADLQGATNIIEQQLMSASIDSNTILPDGSRGPFRPGSGAHEPKPA